MVRKSLQRTQLAMRGMSFADRFNALFERHAVSGYSPRLVEPQGESTGGGKQAVQHVVLQHPDPSQPTLTVGWANCANNNARLRTLGCMQQLVTRRFGPRRVVLDAAAYQAFFQEAKAYLEKNGMQVSVEEQPPEVASGAHPAVGADAGSSPTLWIVAGLALVALGLALWFLASRL